MYQIEIYQDLAWQSLATWQTPDTPFMQFAFLQALADSQAICEQAGWLPLYILIKHNTELKAVLPVFIKDHHQGEYVFDHAWADAYYRYGADYYPRLVTSVPFTPVTGERFWLVQGQNLNEQIWQTAGQAIEAIAKQIKASTWHGLFFDKQSLEEIKKSFVVSLSNHNDFSYHPSTSSERTETLIRYGCQFLWHNLNKNGEKFSDFDDFLSILTAKKRKSIKVERQKVAKQGLTCQTKLGADITDDDWQIFYQCYAMTYYVRGRQPYLTLEFFEQIGKSMRDNVMLAQAFDSQGDVVACALFFYDSDTLYGRYWGCLADFDSLHFELCYYQGIAFAIQQGLSEFDPGTQGEHKLIRGFMPTLSYSLHRVYDKQFEPATANFCKQEQQAVLHYYQDAMTAMPFNQDYLDSLASANLLDEPSNDR